MLPSSGSAELPSADAVPSSNSAGSLNAALPPKFNIYLELSKPGVGGLVIVTTLCGALTAPGRVAFGRLLITLMGTALVVAGANAANMWLERDTDVFMRRTRTRPLPSGRLAPEAALWFSGLTCVAGLALLVSCVGWLTAALAALAYVSYVAAYTPLKRVTPLALFVGAVPGAIPPLIGWASARGELSTLGWLEFLVLFVWQLPHFLAIAIFRRDEYARAGLLVLPVVHGVRRTKIEILLYSAALVAVSLLPVGLGLTGLGYAAVAIACGLPFLVLASAGLSVADDRRWARRVFFASMPYLVLTLGALSIFSTR
ncbi:MAG TPA: heme o synthase [Polyangiaceae bacterium]|nr:heme o synthase [Polyangiaceae bacterium]